MALIFPPTSTVRHCERSDYYLFVFGRLTMARHEVQIMLEVQVLFQGESGVRKAHGLVLGAQVSMRVPKNKANGVRQCKCGVRVGCTSVQELTTGDTPGPPCTARTGDNPRNRPGANRRPGVRECCGIVPNDGQSPWGRPGNSPVGVVIFCARKMADAKDSHHGQTQQKSKR
jgi:hypothetical protein